MENKKLKVYYAHFMGIYNTKVEQRDIELLQKLGFEVLNPNSEDVSLAYEDFERNQSLLASFPETYEVVFDKFWGGLVRGCDLLAYKALPTGQISGGVALEIDAATKAGIPVIAIPNSTELSRLRMTGEETMGYLYDMGVR